MFGWKHNDKKMGSDITFYKRAQKNNEVLEQRKKNKMEC